MICAWRFKATTWSFNLVTKQYQCNIDTLI